VPDFDVGAIDVTILLPYLLTPQQSGVQEQRKLCGRPRDSWQRLKIIWGVYWRLCT